MIDTNRLLFPAIDTGGYANAHMSTFPCLLLGLICADHSLILLILEVNATFICALLFSSFLLAAVSSGLSLTTTTIPNTIHVINANEV